jgi:transcriptional regulator with XRE-family HTH domain
VVTVQDTARPRLRELRLARGWTQQDVADRLVKLAWMRRPRKNVGCNADMVAKWENGRKGISPLYRELLAKLYGVTIAQLGIDPDAGLVAESSETDRSLVSFLDTAACLLDQLGAAGAVLQPQLFALWKDEIANRRAMFALLDPTTGPQIGLPAVPLDLNAFDQLADTFERLYETADPAALLTPVAAQVRLLGEILRTEVTTGDQQRLLANRARVAILAGRLAFERLHNSMSARAFYSVANDDARELGNDALHATVLGLSAQIAVREGKPVAARRDLSAALALVARDSTTAQWLLAISQEVA